MALEEATLKKLICFVRLLNFHWKWCPFTCHKCSFWNNHYFEYHPPKYGHGKKNQNRKHSCVLKLTVSTCALETSSSHLETLAVGFPKFPFGAPASWQVQVFQVPAVRGPPPSVWVRTLFYGYQGDFQLGELHHSPKNMHQLYMATRFSVIDLLRSHGKNHPHLPEPLSTCLAKTIP